MKFLWTVLAFPLLASAASARSIPDHPILEGILGKYDGKVVSTACSSLKDSAFKKIAAAENFESALLLREREGGGCKMGFIAIGGKDYVDRDPALYNSLVSDPGTLSAIDLHVHPLANGAYFRAGGVYQAEIMFASEAAIRENQLPADLYDALVAKVQEGGVPGFNLSPPSIPDMLIASQKSKIPLQYVVATSGGNWSYSFSSDADQAGFWKQMDDIKSVAIMYGMANAEGGSAGKKQRAQVLFAINMQNAETKALVDEWQACSLGLRKPYSKEAISDLLAGKTGKIQAEFQEKIALAGRWSALMGSLGMTMEFQAFQ